MIKLCLWLEKLTLDLDAQRIMPVFNSCNFLFKCSMAVVPQI